MVFGPVPRGYAHALPKKMRRAALVSALSARCGEGAITVVDALEVTGFKTRGSSQPSRAWGWPASRC